MTILDGTKWKLTSVVSNISGHEDEVIDCSERNVVFEFLGNNKLLITGSLPKNLFDFNVFKEGKHFYELREPEGYCGDDCGPNPTLKVVPPILGERTEYYFYRNMMVPPLGGDIPMYIFTYDVYESRKYMKFVPLK
jgi:hypothetical protein